jgi:tetratricopeptide (TPR) repeat protein
VLKKQGRFPEAVREFREALRLNPDLAAAHYNLGNAFMMQRSLGEAERAYREAVRLKPDYAEAFSNLGLVLDQQGRRKEARPFWERALKLEKRPERLGYIQKRLAEPD